MRNKPKGAKHSDLKDATKWAKRMEKRRLEREADRKQQQGDNENEGTREAASTSYRKGL